MKNTISKELKRYNYLFGETGAAYHEMYLKLGMSDSAISILYAVLEQGGSRPLQQIRHCTGLSKQTINSANWRRKVSSIYKWRAQKIKPFTSRKKANFLPNKLPGGCWQQKMKSLLPGRRKT